jgi:hypothetical protein
MFTLYTKYDDESRGKLLPANKKKIYIYIYITLQKTSQASHAGLAHMHEYIVHINFYTRIYTGGSVGNCGSLKRDNIYEPINLHSSHARRAAVLFNQIFHLRYFFIKLATPP